MKRSNLILQSAVAFVLGTTAVGSAQAGQIATTFQTYASEIFGQNAGNIAIKPTAITYQFGVPVAANQPINVYVALSGDATFVAGAVAATDFTIIDAQGIPFKASSVALSTSTPAGAFAVFSFNTGVNGLNTSSTATYIPQANSVNNLAGALSATDGSVNATWTNDSSTSVKQDSVPTGGTNVDTGGTHTGPIAKSGAAIVGKIVASSAFSKSPAVAEAKQIDLTAVPVGTKFTTETVDKTNTFGNLLSVNLGSVNFSNVSGLQADAAGNDYTVAGKASGVTVVVTGDFSAIGTGGSIALSTALDGTAAPIAGTLSADKKTATFKNAPLSLQGTAPNQNVNYYVFYNTDGKAAIPVQTPAATASLLKTAATDLTDDIAKTDLYALVQNGAQVDLPSFVPASATGYFNTVRVVNTGTITAPVFVSKVAADGTIGTASALKANGAAVTLKGGGATTVSPADIDASLGTAIPASERPRLRFTASTNGLYVQSLLGNPGGTYTEISSGAGKQQ